MKYNLSLDLVAAAIETYKKGDVRAAADMFVKAAKHSSASSAVKVINASNRKAFGPIKTAASAKTMSLSQIAKRLERAADEDGVDRDLAGEELRVEVDDSKEMPVVQEGGFEDIEDEEPDGDEGDEDEVAETAKFARVLKNLTR